VNDKARFYARTSGYTLWMTEEGLVFDSSRKKETPEGKQKIEEMPNAPLPARQMESAPVEYERDVSRLVFRNANRHPEIIAVDMTEHKMNYFVGNDKSKWKKNISSSKAVLYKELYPNIDLKVYGVENQIEYDWIVKPGGNVEDISFEYKEVKGTRIDEGGNLVVTTRFGDLTHKKPYSYQEIEGTKKEVTVKFNRTENNRYAFIAAEYDRNYELVIDPLVLVYSTYFHPVSSIADIKVDNNSYIYISGTTSADDFPSTNNFINSPATYLAFVTKYSPDGQTLIFSTVFGGSNIDSIFDTTFDSNNCIYLTGHTGSTNFPTTLYAYQTSSSGLGDIFVTKLSPSGNELLYSTFVGGARHDVGLGIAVNNNGYAYITGHTLSSNFPTTPNALVGSYQNTGNASIAFLTKLSPNGRSLSYSTYFYARDGNDIVVDDNGFAYITGTAGGGLPVVNAYQSSYGGGRYDAYLTKFSPDCASLIFSTYIGGSEIDQSLEVSVDNSGCPYITGNTNSTDFPLYRDFQGWRGSHDCFIVKFSSDGSEIVYSTLIGGLQSEGGWELDIDSFGNAYVIGSTSSQDLLLKNPYQDTYNGNGDIFVAKVSFNGNSSILEFSTYFGGSAFEGTPNIDINSNGSIYISSNSNSQEIPLQNPIYTDPGCFISKFDYVSSGSLTVTAPNGGEYWSSSDTETISWNYTDIDDSDTVRLILLQDNSPLGTIAEGIPITDRQYPWSVGQTDAGAALPGCNYTIRVETMSGAYADDSDGVFCIDSSGITVTSPNGGEILDVGTSHTITWNTHPSIGFLKIEYSTNNGNSFQTIPNASSVANTGSFDWTIPNTASETCLVRITQVSGSPNDVSDAVFTIRVPPPPPSITVLNPNGGEIWIPGTWRNITWTSVSMSGNVSIALYKGNTSYSALGTANVLTGSFTWAIPSGFPEGEDYSIRIYQGTVEDYSNSYFSIKPFPLICHTSDYDGEGTDDMVIFRPETGRWCIYGEASQAWGAPGDLPVPGDYDRDGSTDLAIFRAHAGEWRINMSSGSSQTTAWGAPSDIPVPGDYDGDAQTDIAIFRPTTGEWRIKRSSSTSLTVAWGAPNDIPIPGDYDGDGSTDIAIYRPGTGEWRIKKSSGSSQTTAWGAAGDIPVPGDYDGDGKTNIAIFRPSTSEWRINTGASSYIVQWGVATDIPMPADYDGDGDTDIAIFRPSNGRWCVYGQPSIPWGVSTDIPLVTHIRK
ncbi:MAG: hypothetical protein GY765_25570, partial [bacterium]|nr:hypothetical protein [bacterium]